MKPADIYRNHQFGTGDVTTIRMTKKMLFYNFLIWTSLTDHAGGHQIQKNSVSVISFHKRKHANTQLQISPFTSLSG